MDSCYQEVYCLAIGSDGAEILAINFPRAMLNQENFDGSILKSPIMKSLVLVPTGQPQEFRRIGFSEHMFESAFAGCDESVVTIL